MRGFSSAMKNRWAVVLPRYTLPTTPGVSPRAAPGTSGCWLHCRGRTPGWRRHGTHQPALHAGWGGGGAHTSLPAALVLLSRTPAHPHPPPPQLPSRLPLQVSTVRFMLWLYKDAQSSDPRTKVWLDGASAYQVPPAGSDGVEGILVHIWGFCRLLLG